MDVNGGGVYDQKNFCSFFLAVNVICVCGVRQYSNRPDRWNYSKHAGEYGYANKYNCSKHASEYNHSKCTSKYDYSGRTDR